DRLDLGPYKEARPRALSGGQAQRVALARALATEPRLLLLAGPLAALDAAARGAVRRDLRRHLASFDGIRIVITHDPLEAVALADRLVILESGRVVQTGSPAEVTRRPRSRYVADLVGVNLFRGIATGDMSLCAAAPRSSRRTVSTARSSPRFTPVPSRSIAPVPRGRRGTSGAATRRRSTSKAIGYVSAS